MRHPFIFLILLCAPLFFPATSHAAFTSETNLRNRLIEETRSKATALESNGQLREALEQWWVMDALSTRENAQDNISRLQARIDKLSEEALARGLKAKSQGKIAQAQQALLMVLQLQPGQADAMAALRDIETDIMLRELKKKGAEGPGVTDVPVM